MAYPCICLPSPNEQPPARPEFRADGYSLYAGGSLLLFGPVDAVAKIAANLNAEPPAAGRLALRVMDEIQAAGGGVFLPREGLRGQW